VKVNRFLTPILNLKNTKYKQEISSKINSQIMLLFSSFLNENNLVIMSGLLTSGRGIGLVSWIIHAANAVKKFNGSNYS
jgi:hypothetical protein